MGYMTSQYRRVPPARIEQREVVRHSVVLERATLRDQSKTTSEVRLLDLSIYGCRLEINCDITIGERLWLRLVGGDSIRATAIWCEEGKLGCRFDIALDPAYFRDITLLSD